ncbi:hypothetical protein R1sor_027165 [Riccia sorocarpa]|uniref:Uncharacterized protein n=1 Tax=Riccia sorocarpa TaxID=122646 RepID=A0ABD3GF61_9MARC
MMCRMPPGLRLREMKICPRPIKRRPTLREEMLMSKLWGRPHDQGPSHGVLTHYVTSWDHGIHKLEEELEASREQEAEVQKLLATAEHDLQAKEQAFVAIQDGWDDGKAGAKDEAQMKEEIESLNRMLEEKEQQRAEYEHTAEEQFAKRSAIYAQMMEELTQLKNKLALGILTMTTKRTMIW